jgi:hypothetical protein
MAWDLSVKPRVKVPTASGRKGGLFEYFIITPAGVGVQTKAQALETLRVEIKGEAAEVVAVVWSAVPNPDGVGTDGTKKRLSCFVKLVKVGEASIKITPVGADGKDRDTIEGRIQVAAPRKKKPEK